MKNLLDLNKFIKQIFSEIPLVNMVDYGEANIINNPTDFAPIQVAFTASGISGISEPTESYEYTVLVLDKVAEDKSDLEGVHSKTAEVCNQLISRINRSENYKVEASSAQLVVNEFNDSLHGWEMLVTISTFNTESICL
jgi:hypothetical protein